MRQAAVETKPEKKNIFLPPLLLITLAVMLLTSGTIFMLRRAEKEAAPTLLEQVSEKAAAAAVFKHYALVIEESGPGYSLRFSGQVHEDRMYGKIDGYDLEIFAEEERFFVKNAVAAGWQDLKTAKLETLPVLLRDPHYLLSTLLAEKDIVVEAGSNRTVNNAACQTYFLEIPPPALQLLTHFGSEAVIDKLQVYLWFAEEDAFLHRMAVMMNVTVGEQSIHINRTYNLTCDAPDFPEDIPKTDTKTMPI
ncbi:MAG: hypothetical protein ACOX4N_09305 [Dethiobacteraceae bacterium]|jgi:hypothetical protein|nr:hypothetical protein [Bacillota bacterium]